MEYIKQAQGWFKFEFELLKPHFSTTLNALIIFIDLKKFNRNSKNCIQANEPTNRRYFLISEKSRDEKSLVEMIDETSFKSVRLIE